MATAKNTKNKISQVFKGFGRKFEIGANRITVVRKYIIEMPIIAFVFIFLVVIIYNEFLATKSTEADFSIGKFSIPKYYVEMGYSSPVVRNLLNDKVIEKQKQARENINQLEVTLYKSFFLFGTDPAIFGDRNIGQERNFGQELLVNVLVQVKNSPVGSELSLEETRRLSLPGTGLTIDDFIKSIKEVFKIESDVRSINGEIICKNQSCPGESLQFNLRYATQAGGVSNISVYADDIDELIDNAANEILRLTSPKDLAVYFYYIDSPEGPKQTIKILSKLHDDPLYALHFEAHHLHGVIALVEEDYRLASFHFSVAHTHDQARLWNTLFWAFSLLKLEQAGNFSRAADNEKSSDELFQMALDNEQNKSISFYFWGTALYNVTLYDQAEEKFEAALELNSDDYFVLNTWGQMLSEMGDLDRALEKFRNASERVPENDRDYAKYIYNNWALIEVEKAIAVPIEDEANFFKHLAAAENLYAETVNLDIDDYNSHYYLGVIRSAMGKCEEALDPLLTSVEIKEDFVDGYLSLGDSFSCLEEYELAAIYYEEADYWNQDGYWEQDDAEYFFQWGYALFESEDFAGATEKFENAVALDDSFAEAHLLLGILYVLEDRTTEGEAEIIKALDIDPSLGAILDEFLSDDDSA